MADELKHTTISLIEDGILVADVLAQSELGEKTVSSMVECKARGAYLCAVTSYENCAIEDATDFVACVSKVDEKFMANLAVNLLKLFGYYMRVV